MAVRLAIYWKTMYAFPYVSRGDPENPKVAH